MNIQELENKYRELGAEIERLKQQPEGVWEPEKGDSFWVVDATGATHWFYNGESKKAKKHHNVYENESLARKASVLQRRANLVIQACLNFDPDFVPDWRDAYQHKYGFRYWHFNPDFGENPRWIYEKLGMGDSSAACVSTQEIAVKVVAYLNSQGIK